MRPVHASDILGPVRGGEARLSPGVLVSLGLVTASPTSVNFHVVLDADFFFSLCMILQDGLSASRNIITTLVDSGISEKLQVTIFI